MLVSAKEMLEKAKAGHYAVGQFNINNLEWTKSILLTAEELKSPVILGVSEGAGKYMCGYKTVVGMVNGMLEELNITVPVALHLDHGPDFETCKECIDGGFTSVMIDGSSLPYEENVALTKKVVEYAHAHGVVVEGELGTLAGVEDDVKVDADNASYTRPEEVYDFVTRTGVDSLAIAIGTSHGAYKFKPGQKPQLRFDILEEVGKKLPGFPIVLHGASSVNQDHIKIINKFGGEMPDAIGIPEDMLRKAASMAVCKINVDSDIRIAMTAAIREHFAENPTHFDPRQYLTPARNLIEEVVAHKIDVVFGSTGHAND